MNVTSTKSFSAVYHLIFHRNKIKQIQQNPNIYVNARTDQWITAKAVPRGKQQSLFLLMNSLLLQIHIGFNLINTNG